MKRLLNKQNILFLCLIILFSINIINAESLIKVTHSNVKWIIQGKLHNASINEKDLTMNVKDGDIAWPSLPSDSSDIVCSYQNENLHLRLTDVHKIKFDPY